MFSRYLLILALLFNPNQNLLAAAGHAWPAALQALHGELDQLLGLLGQAANDQHDPRPARLARRQRIQELRDRIQLLAHHGIALPGIVFNPSRAVLAAQVPPPGQH